MGDYDPYPPIALAAYDGVDIFYPNAGNTGYQDLTEISGTQVWDAEFADMNNDGFLDLVVVDNSDGAFIYWGSSSGTWTTTGKTSLSTTSGRGAAIG
ncbi:MAG: hypothetical protein GWN18_13575, partial [Thermoplasmata archaeon]|nr:VCBS repeat-containing protein [Thermoplasmata archaeon]NIS13091.1 VCBS repeat-containing protein [Thermoplasmata archaeon]NIS20990.1 VCBS repeat-containing protein [Thermoplasmata archaeon]NIT78447.1 VCBS repeat-containing protein [Thermoplasmata archaeon]NIU50046.1 VCBS repeat-containing protein [Thermoplasmata archaeon]